MITHYNHRWVKVTRARFSKRRGCRCFRNPRSPLVLCLLAVAVGLAPAGCTKLDRVPVTAPEPLVLPTPTPVPQAVLPARPTAPTVRTVELGRSVQGRPIVMYVFGDEPRPTLIFAGIHGDEPSSTSIARRLLEYLRAHPDAYEGTSVAVLPVANPDGLKRGTRKNARHVDVNRNFPARNWRPSRRGSRYHGGRRPASEPETRALMRAVEKLRPGRIISIHSISRERYCNNYDGPAAGLAEMMAELNGYPAKASMGYPTPGSFGSWAGIDRSIATITLELPGNLSGPKCWQQNRAALLTAVEAGSAPQAK